MPWFHRWVAFAHMHAHMHTGQEEEAEKGIMMVAHVMKGKDIEEPWEVEDDGVLRGTEGQQHSGKGRQMEGSEVNGESNGMGRGKTEAFGVPSQRWVWGPRLFSLRGWPCSPVLMGLPHVHI